jgi:phosphohistidine phosphatase
LSDAASLIHLVVMRHAPAEDRVAFARSGRPDAQRPLTRRGREKMIANARGLRVVVPSLDVLATSPYTRAVETAAVVASRYSNMRFEHVSVLSPGARPADFLEWLRAPAHAGKTIGIVGHEPDLGELVAWLVTGEPVAFFAFKKGGAACLELDAPIRPGCGTLRWLLSPAVLRSLSE